MRRCKQYGIAIRKQIIKKDGKSYKEKSTLLTTPALQVHNASHNAYAMLRSSLLGKLFFVAYILWDIQKKKATAVH